MPFVWVQNIAIGAAIDSADIVEIRDAADSVLDNLCVIDNAVVLVGDDNGANAGDDVGENVGANAGADVGDDVGENVGANAGADVGDDVGENVGANIGEDVGDDFIINVSADTVELIGENVAVDTDDKISEDLNDFVVDNPTNYPGAVALEEASDKSSHDSDVA